MHGCGNDYIYIDCFSKTLDGEPSDLAARLSDRHFGIGGDGLVLIMPSEVADAKMRMFNQDGSEAQMCGNAIRCVARYLCNTAPRESLTIETLSGIKSLKLLGENVQVNMGAASFLPDGIISMGNPHKVVFCEDVDGLRLSELGPTLPQDVNNEFVEVLGKNRLKMRVWERGSGETLCCGTGACASAAAAVQQGFCDKDTDILVELPGGELTIRYTEEAVMMTGGAVTVFDGTVEV